jgi:tetratricopeptide (TPR) repeat protein
MTVHTWVREDLFAGYMVDDLDRWKKGVAKLNEILKAEPDNPDALGWHADNLVYQASRAYAAGDKEQAEKLWQEAMATAKRALSQGPNSGGALRTIGAGLVYFSDRLPEPRRTEAIQQGRKLFLTVQQQEKGMADQMPLHQRGEVLAALAQSADRLGLKAERDEALATIVQKMPGSVYARRAQAWMNGNTGSALVCQTCHEEGRLEPSLKRLAAK